MTAEGVRSLRAARAARASVVATVRSGGGGGVSGSVLRGYGISKTKTGTYKYYDPERKGYVTTKPAAQIAAEKAVEVKVEPTKKIYFYDPKTRVLTTRKVEGQEAMTKQEGLTVIRRMPRQTKVEYGEAYRGYTEAKRGVQRAELAALEQKFHHWQKE